MELKTFTKIIITFILYRTFQKKGTMSEKKHKNTKILNINNLKYEII